MLGFHWTSCIYQFWKILSSYSFNYCLCFILSLLPLWTSIKLMLDSLFALCESIALSYFPFLVSLGCILDMFLGSFFFSFLPIEFFLAYRNNLLPGGNGGKRGQNFAASTQVTLSSYFTKEIFTAASPLHKLHPVTPRLTEYSFLVPSSSWFPADLGLQPPDLGGDLGPELTLVLGTSWPLPGLSSPCGPVLSLISLDVPLGGPSGDRMGCVSPVLLAFFQNFNLGFLNLKHMCFYKHLCKHVFYRSIYMFL